MKCRHCGTPLRHTFLDLGASPPSNAYLKAEALQAPETWFPLRVMVCDACWLVQTEDYAGREALFTEEYAYFSSTSTSWLKHSQAYVEAMRARFKLGPQSHVVEIAANDGYLLQYVKAAGIPCTGIEPTRSTADAARSKGIEIVEEFFGVALGEKLARQGKAADLTAANNVLAHVPDINDFVGGFAKLLKPQGVSTFEFPHLLNMVALNQFDTAYHEHYSYLSLTAVHRIFAANGLSVFDVEEIPTHGGSLRVFAQRSDTGQHVVTEAVGAMLAREKRRHEAARILHALPEAGGAREGRHRRLPDRREEEGPARGCLWRGGQGQHADEFRGHPPRSRALCGGSRGGEAGPLHAGSRIPIVEEAHLWADKPDLVLILPWNIRAEVMEQLAGIRAWGGKFVVAVPKLEVT